MTLWHCFFPKMQEKHDSNTLFLVSSLLPNGQHFNSSFNNLSSSLICHFSQRYDMFLQDHFIFYRLHNHPKGSRCWQEVILMGSSVFGTIIVLLPLYKPSQNELLISNGFTATFLRQRTLYFWVHGLSFFPF